jgi:hypothetical protein
MQSYIQEMLGLSQERIQNLSNLKTPMETTATIHKVLGIEPRQRVKTITERMVDVAKNTGNAITNAADTMMNKISTAIMGEDFMSDVNLFEDLDEMDELWSGSSPVSMPKNQEIPDIPQDPKPMAEKQEKPQRPPRKPRPERRGDAAPKAEEPRTEKPEQLKTEDAQEKVRRRKPYYHNRRRKPRDNGGAPAGE